MIRWIKKFIAGDSKRTAFSAGVMNEIVGGLNQFLGTRAGKGIVINRADAGWVISWDPNSQGEAALPGEGGGTSGAGSSLAFQGDWSGADTYVVGDIVIKHIDPDNFDDGSAGTYICIADVVAAGAYEPGVATGWGGHWALFARGFWSHIKFESGSAYTDINGPILKGVKFSATNYSTIANTIASGSLPRSFTWDGGFGYISHYDDYAVKPFLFIVRVDPNVSIPTMAETDRAIVLDLGACQNIDTSMGVHPRLLKIREIDICDSGVAKKMLVLCSAPYTLAP
ncbi:MAG: hypothetical protein JWM68_2527 [Verrucomicrobiales bacterium]|nr:hypothetical protein [Verrucomicrobiales bacterium]